MAVLVQAGDDKAGPQWQKQTWREVGGDSGEILKEELPGFADGLDAGYEKEELRARLVLLNKGKDGKKKGCVCVCEQ